MLTIDALKELGADTDAGLVRCLNNEEFYLKLVKMAIDDGKYEKLREDITAGSLDDAFEAAHALKGMLGNVSLDNLLEPVTAITEGLRAKESLDYGALLDQMEEELKKLRAL